MSDGGYADGHQATDEDGEQQIHYSDDSNSGAASDDERRRPNEVDDDDEEEVLENRNDGESEEEEQQESQLDSRPQHADGFTHRRDVIPIEFVEDERPKLRAAELAAAKAALNKPRGLDAKLLAMPDIFSHDIRVAEMSRDTVGVHKLYKRMLTSKMWW